MNTVPSSADGEASDAVPTTETVRVERTTTAFSIGFYSAILLAKDVLARRAKSCGEALDVLNQSDTAVQADLSALIGIELAERGVTVGNRYVETQVDPDGPTIVLVDRPAAAAAPAA
jgi:hypothetical protein